MYGIQAGSSVTVILHIYMLSYVGTLGYTRLQAGYGFTKFL